MKKTVRSLLYLLGILLILGGILLALVPKLTHLQYTIQVKTQYLDFLRQQEPPQVSPDRPEASPETQPPLTDLDRLYQLMAEKNQALYENHQPGLSGPSAYASPEIDPAQYGLSDGVVAYLTIPRMDITLPVLLGANGPNMTQGAGHLTHTSYPIGGENTNCVLAAHRGYARTAMFRDIEGLQPGDPVYLQNFRQLLAYRVSEIQVISPDQVEAIYIQPGRDLLTLLTCHPLHHNYQRYLVFCSRDIALEQAAAADPAFPSLP